VIAVGGNALQRRGERLTIENMLKAAADMAPTIAGLASEHELVLTHGNGPQVGELALERSAATFDVLGAESMGQIGYVLAQALASVGTKAAPILTQVVVDPSSEAFKNPSKFVGPIYGAKEANALAQSLGWTVKADGEYFRRVVPSPPPLEILQTEAVRTLLEHAPDILPIACGGGGVPVARVPSCPSTLVGVEAVIDKDICGAKLACDLEADGYIILTDGGGIWKDFGKPTAKEMKMASPEYLMGTKAGKNFPGSMGPKIEAAIAFVENSKSPNAWAAIGDLKDAAKIFGNEEGTIIKHDVQGGVVWREGKVPEVKHKESKEPHKSG
jgi:carbamate kinase